MPAALPPQPGRTSPGAPLEGWLRGKGGAGPAFPLLNIPCEVQWGKKWFPAWVLGQGAAERSWVVYYPTRSSDGRGLGRLEEVRLDGARKMRLTAFGQVVGGSEAAAASKPRPVAATNKEVLLAVTDPNSDMDVRWRDGSAERTPAWFAAREGRLAGGSDPGARAQAAGASVPRGAGPGGSDPQVMAVKKAVLEAASAQQEGSHRARRGGTAAPLRMARAPKPPSRRAPEGIAKATGGDRGSAGGKAKAKGAGNASGAPTTEARATGAGDVPEVPGAETAKAGVEAPPQGRAAAPGKEETVWTGFRETYRRRAKGGGPPPEKELQPEKETRDARGTKRREPPKSSRGRIEGKSTPPRVRRARTESSSESESEDGGAEWTEEEVLQAFRDATELKYEKKIDWSDVPACLQYSLTKKEYQYRIKALNARGPGRGVPSEEGVRAVMGNWSVALRKLGMKRHGVGVRV